MASSLTQFIETLGLAEHSEFLSGRARPSVEILTADGPAIKRRSRFGGSPDLPAGFEWPRHAHGLYRFIGQVDLVDVPTGPHELPGDGLLSFFYAHDEDGESFWGDPDYVRVYRFDKLEALRQVELPDAVRFGSTIAVRFQLGYDVPPWPWDASEAKDWPIQRSQRDAYWELRLRLHPSGRYLLGYPLNTTLAYDPTPGREWRSLLTLRSDDELEWSWHDGDWLVTFIEQQRLRVGDFTRIDADAG